MNGPLIFTVIHIIKALECADQKHLIGTNDTKFEHEANSTGSEDVFKSDQPADLVKFSKKTCSCPCNAVPRMPICGRTTNGISKTFDSQCHLICHNQCEGSVERYAVTFFGECPVVPALNRKNVFSHGYENRRIEYGNTLHPAITNPIHLFEKDAPVFIPNAYEIYGAYRPPSSYGAAININHQNHDFFFISPSESYKVTKSNSPSTFEATTTLILTDTPSKTVNPNVQYSSVITADSSCDCNHCPETRWIRLDYYPICGEQNGQRRTFDSWCHFDCENKCVRRSGDSFLYMHKGACAVEPDEEAVVPRTVNVASTEVCAACSSLCKTYYEPVCARNGRNEYLSFKSRCHVWCHNQCHYYQRKNENYMPVSDGPCSWQ